MTDKLIDLEALEEAFRRQKGRLSVVAASGSYDDLTDKPTSFPPSEHSHNADTINSVNASALTGTIAITGAVNGSASLGGSNDISITVTGESEAAKFLATHPVGSAFLSFGSSLNPAEKYGGTWTAITTTYLFLGITIYRRVA